MRRKRRLIRLPEVLSKTGGSRTAIYAGVEQGTFPSPVKIGRTRAIAWVEDEVDAWIEAQIEARDGRAA
jgi:prophage regulatory protein